MVKLARSEPGIPVVPEELDQDTYLLNCLNGTLDLRTGTLRPHAPTDLITKLAGADYDPDAHHQTWERFLESSMPDPGTRSYVQKLTGYSATGDGSEDVLVLVHGGTGSGKTTFKEGLLQALGEYAAVADFSAFVASRHQTAGPRPEIVALRGSRIVLVSELEGNQKLAMRLLKQLSGGDHVTARGLWKSGETFKASFVLWMLGEDRPQVDDDDAGAWRRLREIPFRKTYRGKGDPAVKRAIISDPDVRRAILAWIVQGAIRWFKVGLGEAPTEVIEATTDYRQAMDPLAQWVQDCARLQPNAWTPAGTLRESYEAWCRENGTRQVSGKQFGTRLRDLKLKPHRRGGKGVRGWLGIGLLTGEADAETVGTDSTGGTTVKSALSQPLREGLTNPGGSGGSDQESHGCAHPQCERDGHYYAPDGTLWCEQHGPGAPR